MPDAHVKPRQQQCHAQHRAPPRIRRQCAGPGRVQLAWNTLAKICSVHIAGFFAAENASYKIASGAVSRFASTGQPAPENRPRKNSQCHLAFPVLEPHLLLCAAASPPCSRILAKASERLRVFQRESQRLQRVIEAHHVQRALSRRPSRATPSTHSPPLPGPRPRSKIPPPTPPSAPPAAVASHTAPPASATGPGSPDGTSPLVLDRMDAANPIREFDDFIARRCQCPQFWACPPPASQNAKLAPRTDS